VQEKVNEPVDAKTSDPAVKAKKDDKKKKN
jgi:hypothetical protein